MYLHLSSHIYLAYYNDDMICLDLNEDTYTIFSSIANIVISYIILNSVEYEDKKYIPSSHTSISNSEFDSIIKLLISKKVIQKLLYAHPSHNVINKKVSKGIRTSEWSITNTENSNKISFFTLLYYLYILLKVRVILKVLGINYIIKTVIKKKNSIDNAQSNMETVNKLRNNLNIACMFFPTKTKCLEWAIAYIFIAFRKKIKCNLVIGVQTMPFVAHAWIEYDNKPFSDSLDIANNVAIILSEPFKY